MRPSGQQRFPECLLGSEMVLSDTKDMKEGSALCLKTQARGNVGGEPGQGPWVAGRACAKPRREEGLTLKSWGQGYLEWQDRRAGAQTGQTWTPGRPQSLRCSLQTMGKSRKHVAGGCVAMWLREATPTAGRKRDGRHEMEMEPTREVRQPGPRERGKEWMQVKRQHTRAACRGARCGRRSTRLSSGSQTALWMLGVLFKMPILRPQSSF